MAKNDMEIENEESAGKFERFLFLMIPIIFLLVMLGVLLTLFNMDIRNNVLEVANKIPFIEKWVPDPPADPSAAPDEDSDPSEAQQESSDKTIKQLKEQIEEEKAAVAKANEVNVAQAEQVENLKKDIAELKEEAEAVAATEETEDPYEKQVSDLAKLYGGMKASKAAPIMENLTTEEMVQIFSAMNNASKTAILEKMDPKKAAEVSVKLKETVSSTDMAIAALQSRLKQEATAAAPAATTSLDKEKLSQTFAAMPATEAASLLTEMYKLSSDKVISILTGVSDSVRSSILAEMTKKNAVQTAKIANRLVSSK
ncbi:MotE family protein [Paenibacillus donghaensis]|uniref:Magnesium transporter MgtE intracellular domain-containing protein n=1 Tax=Paenibacillus donghaensis TaxID=414771 RepID=A0A2Z2KGH3_9BACL|nr:kinesin [Paenibacillus donghaensis]ASA22260.1 hypothetical protein B9T62_16585 [Paenibacillus donghaensis]